MKLQKLVYDLKKPCADCPFLRATKLHNGIGEALTEYSANVEMGRFAHTCHKTDIRADSEEGKRFKGQPRHCAGAAAMIIQERIDYQDHIWDQAAKNNLDWKAMMKVTGLYSDLKDLAMTYLMWFHEGAPSGKTGNDYEHRFRRG